MTTTTTTISRTRRMARMPQSSAVTESRGDRLPALSDKPQTKAVLVGQMLARETGATVDELCTVTGWQPHSLRAFLTGLRKQGLVLERSKRADKATVYRSIVADCAAPQDSEPASAENLA